MGIHLFYSRDIEDLAECLAGRLEEERRSNSDPFVPQRVVVPNRPLTKWLQLQFALREGIAMNLEFPLLEKGLWNLLLETYLAPEDRTIRLLSRDEVQLHILEKLLNPGGTEPFPLFLDYLNRPNHLSPSGKVARAWQISERLARLFSDYEYHREGMIGRWLEENGGATGDSVEANERSLYRAIFGKGGRLSGDGEEGAVRSLTLAQLWREIQNRPGKEGQESERRPVHVFGFSHLSPFHLGLLFHLGEAREVFLYAFNLSRELWGGGEWKSPVDYWGKPGSGLVRLIRHLSRHHKKVPFEEVHCPSEQPFTDTLLGTLQNWVRHPETTPQPAPRPQDRSLQIVGCPGRYREVETVYQSILANMETDPELRLTDIAVLVTDMRVYKPILESVFDGSDPPLPYNLSDSTAETDSLFAQAVRQMLLLAESRFTRKQVFDFLFNPMVLEALRVPREEVELWLNWSEALHLFGSTSEDEIAGEFVPFDWRTGIHRLELGRIMEPPETSDDGHLPHYRELVPYADMDTSDSGRVGQFVSTLDDLLEGLRPLSAKSMSSGAWADTIHALVDRFLKVPADRPEERSVRESLFASLEDLSILDGVDEEGIPFPVLRQFVESRLKNLASHRGRFLTGGVTLSSMRPLRPIPFEVVYVLGLDEGKFPGSSENSTLDLRHPYKELGDVTVPEANRYLFLETLMVTRKKLYLTYPNRDLAKDREISPCSVVEELKRIVAPLLDTGPMKEASVPFSGTSEEYLKRQENDWSDVFVQFSHRDRLLSLLRLQEEGRLTPEVSERVEESVRKMAIEKDSYGSPSLTEKEPVYRIRFGELKRFLQDPIDSLLGSELGVRDEEESDPGLAEDEPLVSAFPADYEILTEAIRFPLSKKKFGPEAAQEAESYLTHLYEGKSRCGEVPWELFGKLDREGFRSSIEGVFQGTELAEDLSEFTDTIRDKEFFHAVQIGESDDRIENVHRLPPIRLSLESVEGGRPVEIHGSLSMVWRGEEDLYVLVTAPTSLPPAFLPSKHVLLPYLFYLGLLTVPETDTKGLLTEDRGLVVGVVYRDTFKAWRYRQTRNRAKKILTELVADYLLDPQFDHLPLQVFSKLSKRDTEYVLGLLREESPTDTEASLLESFLKDKIETLESGTFHRKSDSSSLVEADLPRDLYRVCRQRLLPFLEGEPWTRHRKDEEEIR